MADEVISFPEALAQTEGLEKFVLLGNGFSVAWDHKIFSYRSLRERAKGLSEPARKVFAALDTVDFELVIKAFEYAGVVCNALGQKNDFQAIADEVRELLISTIADNHPDLPLRIEEEQFESCVAFLKHFSKIYTLNYDLLLYWVLIRDMFPEEGRQSVLKRMQDGFAYNEEEFLNWDGTSFDIHFLHGALHLFEQTELLKLNWRKTSEPLKKQFVRLIKEQRKLPLFVAEGSSPNKLQRIRSSGYLTRCFNSLQKIGSKKKSSVIFSFGVSFHENDAHILDAIAKNNCDQIYVSIFGKPELDANRKTIGRVKRILALRERRSRPTTIRFYQAETASVWGAKRA